METLKYVGMSILVTVWFFMIGVTGLRVLDMHLTVASFVILLAVSGTIAPLFVKWAK